MRGPCFRQPLKLSRGGERRCWNRLYRYVTVAGAFTCFCITDDTMSLLTLHDIDGYLHFDEEECMAAGRALAESYQNASPFPHAVVEDFLDVDLLRQVATNYPSTDGKEFFDRDQERLKFQFMPTKCRAG